MIRGELVSLRLTPGGSIILQAVSAAGDVVEIEIPFKWRETAALLIRDAETIQGAAPPAAKHPDLAAAEPAPGAPLH